MSAALALVWANRKIIAQGLGIALLAFMLYWYFVHNPKVIKSLEIQVTEQKRQVQLRDNAINLLGTIERAHDEITKQTDTNIQKIRTGRKPGNRGVFIPDGMLANVFTNYSAR